MHKKHGNNVGSIASVSALLRGPNPWAAALEGHDYEPLSGPRFMALMLRELPPLWMVERLAPALLAADQEAQEEVEQYLTDFPVTEDQPFGFEHWLGFWDRLDEGPYERAMFRVACEIGGTPDLRLFSDAMKSDMAERSWLLWFVLNGIQDWAENDIASDDVSKGVRWLIDLLTGDHAMAPGWRNKDPLGLLFAYLYNRFRTNTGHAVDPLPDDFDIGPAPEVDYESGVGPAPHESMILIRVAANSDEAEARLSDVFDFDAVRWPMIANKISAMRRAGLLSTTGLHLTPSGQNELDQDREKMTRPRVVHISSGRKGGTPDG